MVCNEPQNLEIALGEIGDFQVIVLLFCVWEIGVAPRRVRKNQLVNRNSAKQSESVTNQSKLMM